MRRRLTGRPGVAPALLMRKRVPRHVGRTVLRGAAQRDFVDPGPQVAQCPAGELQQFLIGRPLVGQAGVVELFAGPGSLAKVFQPHHARAALQGMEGASNRREQWKFTRRLTQLTQRAVGCAQNFARFFQEDLTQFFVLADVDGRARAGRQRRSLARMPSSTIRRPGRADRRHEIGHGLGQAVARRQHTGFVFGLGERPLGLPRYFGQATAVGRARALRKALEAACQVGAGDVTLRCIVRKFLRLIEKLLLKGRPGLRGMGSQFGMVFAAPHDGVQGARNRVKDKQRLGHLRLHAEHVDQETQRAQVASQTVEYSCLGHALQIDFSRCQPIHFIAHAYQRGRGVVHAEHRQNATHCREVLGHLDQRLAVRGVTEELVNQFLGLRQRCAQFLDNAAHGLAV